MNMKFLHEKYDFRRMPKSNHPVSRDYALEPLPCKCSACHCNDGKGYCVVPSKAVIGPDAVCATGKAAIEREYDRHKKGGE